MSSDGKPVLNRLKDLLPQTPSQTVLALGGLFLIGVVVDAMLPYGHGVNSPLATQTIPQVVAPIDQAPAVATTTPMTMANGGVPGMQPFIPSPPVEFGGRVTQVLTVGLQMGWGQVHIWINDGTGRLLEVSLAPQSYLQQIGCPALENTRVNGIGFRFDPNRPNAELYAKTITVAGVTCRLRDDEGLALWTTPLQ